MAAKSNDFKDGASPGKIFVGGLPKDTTIATFTKHFENYGKIIDSVIMKDRNTGHPRGFGFITYADPSVVDKVIADNHVFSGKQVEIKRTIPKGSVQSKDLRTKKIFVGGLPATATNDDFKSFFSKFGKVMESEIILDHATKRSRGFGFVVFDSEQVVDDLLSKGNMIDFAGAQVEIKKAEPKQASGPPPVPYFSENRGRSFGDGLGGFGDSYSGYGGSRFASSYRTSGSFSSRYGGYGGFGGSAGEFDSGYGGYGGGSFGGYRGESSLGFSSRFGSYGGYGGSYGSGGLGGYSRGGDGYASYLGSYDSGPSGGYGAGGVFGGRGGYSGGGRYHPYSR